jgi:hypothetical protein|tara:strand:- start:99 stop:323 length:225 start_codon:yes stop_codon:yes gene_type:complete
MGTKDKVQRLFNQKQKLEKEIEKLQEKCGHKKAHVKFTYPNKKSQLTALRWVCDDCELVLRIPSDKERAQWLKK